VTKKHIYVYSPSGAVRDKASFRRGIRCLEKLGHTVQVDPDALRSHQRFAGDDATRLAAIQRACTSGADVALISRGGYGISRLLADLDYGALAAATARGTRFIGMSDFTLLQCALLAQTGTGSWSGPVVDEDFGAESNVDDIMLACFDDWLCGQGEGVGWRLPKWRAEQTLGRGPEVYASLAEKESTLWGGNLAALATLVGTPYLPEVVQGVLFLEDTHEHPYRIERLLSQLLWSGILQKQAAVVLGQFSHYKPVPHDRGFKLDTVVAWLRARLQPFGVPVLTGLPFGHVPTKVVLPFGMPVRLCLDGGEAFLLWGHSH